MAVRLVSSTEAQNNFGRIISDVSQEGIRYIVKRHNAVQAVIIGINDFERLLESKSGREEMQRIVREQKAAYNLGERLD